MDTSANAEAPLVDADHDVRRRLALVLDNDDLIVARRLADEGRRIALVRVERIALEQESGAAQ